MKYSLAVALFFALSMFANAQGVKIGNSSAPNAAAILDLESPNKGLLLPRLNDSDMRGILNAPRGLMLFNTSDSSLYLKSDSGWMKILPAPARISFSAILTANQPLPNFSYVSPAPYSEAFDNGNGFNASTGIYTAPADGVYHFDILVSLDAVTVNTPCVLRVYLNGFIANGGQVTQIVPPRSGYAFTIPAALTLHLNKNDQVSYQILQASGTGNTIFSSGSVRTSFSGFKVN